MVLVTKHSCRVGSLQPDSTNFPSQIKELAAQRQSCNTYTGPLIIRQSIPVVCASNSQFYPFSREELVKLSHGLLGLHGSSYHTVHSSNTRFSSLTIDIQSTTPATCRSVLLLLILESVDWGGCESSISIFVCRRHYWREWGVGDGFPAIARYIDC